MSRGLFILLLLLCVACRPHPEPSHEPAPEPVPEALTEPERDELIDVLAQAAAVGGAECTCVTRRAFERRVRALLSEVEAALGGPVKLGPSDFVVAPGESFDALAALWFARHHDPEQLAAEGRVFRGMGLVHATLDYPEALRASALDEFVAFYDEEERVIYLRHPRLDAPELRSAVLLAVTHALIDREHDLSRLVYDAPHGDARLARMALLQGAAIELWMRLHPGISLEAIEASSREASAFQPPFLQRLFGFPHIAGARYVQSRGWDAAFAEPPDDTLSVLTGEPTSTHTVNAIIPMRELGNFEPAEPEYEGTLGVFVLRAWFELVGQHEDAEALTEGWRGDHLWSFKRGEKNMLLLNVSLWASDAQAQAFHDAVQALFRLRYHRKRNYFSEAAVDGSVVIWLEGLVGEDATQDRALERMMRSVSIDGQPRMDAEPSPQVGPP